MPSNKYISLKEMKTNQSRGLGLVSKTKRKYLMDCVVLLLEPSSISDSTRLHLILVLIKLQIKLFKPNSNT